MSSTRPHNLDVSPGPTAATVSASSGTSRSRVIAAWVVIAVCAVWLTYYFVSGSRVPDADPALETPAWRLAGELNSKLSGQPGFEGVAFSVSSESPLRLTLTGVVASEAELGRLNEFVKQIRPEDDYDSEVAVRSGG